MSNSFCACDSLVCDGAASGSDCPNPARWPGRSGYRPREISIQGDRVFRFCGSEDSYRCEEGVESWVTQAVEISPEGVELPS